MKLLFSLLLSVLPVVAYSGTLECQEIEKNLIAEVVSKIEDAPAKVELIGHGVAVASYDASNNLTSSAVVTYSFNCLSSDKKEFDFKVLSYQPRITKIDFLKAYMRL